LTLLEFHGFGRYKEVSKEMTLVVFCFLNSGALLCDSMPTFGASSADRGINLACIQLNLVQCGYQIFEISSQQSHLKASSFAGSA
jgi:hypothetical protein